MKTLGLLLIFVFLSGVLSLLGAQTAEPTKSPNIKADAAAVQDWLAKLPPSSETRIEGDRLILGEDRDSYCAFMRTYRMKRESRGSDITRPAGYTTCVPAARFTMKSAVQTVKEPQE